VSDNRWLAALALRTPADVFVPQDFSVYQQMADLTRYQGKPKNYSAAEIKKRTKRLLEAARASRSAKKRKAAASR
jgi:hypothetical protein